jgi:HEAT repeat protein
VKTFLQHPHPKIRLEALRFLYRYPVPVDEELMNRLLEDADVEVQARAVYALGVLMGSSGLLRLISLARKPLIGEGDVALREMAVKGIGREGGERSVQFLSDLMRTRSFLNREAGERVQKAAVEALVEIGGPRVLHALKGALPRLKGQALRSAEDFLRREEVQSS